MQIDDLKKNLDEAYAIENLNRISLTLIELYKNQQFSILQKIAGIISDSLPLEISDSGKGFNKLMLLYHPDRAAFHLQQIQKLRDEGNYDGLLEYSHILRLDRVDEIAAALDSYEDIDYSPVYEWDFNPDEYNIMSEKDPETSYKTSAPGCNFYEAVKKRVFPDFTMEFPAYYLEDTEDFELYDSDINDLEGVEYCLHATTMDLSENKISDLTPLSGLSRLRELNLSDNEISDIDPLSNLINLDVLYLANNQIRDITSLFELTKLSFVDLTGNTLSEEQVEELKEAGVTVEF